MSDMSQENFQFQKGFFSTNRKGSMKSQEPIKDDTIFETKAKQPNVHQYRHTTGQLSKNKNSPPAPEEENGDKIIFSANRLADIQDEKSISLILLLKSSVSLNLCITANPF